SDLSRSQSIDIIKHDKYRMFELPQGSFKFRSPRTDAFHPPLKDPRNDIRRTTRSFDPWSEHGQPRHCRKRLAVILQMLTHISETGLQLQLCCKFHEE